MQTLLASKTDVNWNWLFWTVFASFIVVSTAGAQSSRQEAQKKTAPAAQPSSKAVPHRRLHYGVPQGARDYYAMIWGVEALSVKSAESGEIIRFSYRVLDPVKAKVLNDKRNEPSLIDPGAGVKLVVPKMEKIGQLRQSSTPIEGKVYWMAFSNKGGHVRPGHHVSVTIGEFRADNLIVQ